MIKILYTFLIYSIHITCPACPILKISANITNNKAAPHTIFSILLSLPVTPAKFHSQQPIVTNLQSKEASVLRCNAVLLGK